MKTDLDLKNFYNVEFGKTYKVIKSHGLDFFDLLGRTFHLERRLNEKHGDMFLRVDNGTRFELNTLDDYVYEEVEPLLTPKEKEYLSSVIYPFKDRVVCIYKFSSMSGKAEVIAIRTIVDSRIEWNVPGKVLDTIYLPFFKAGTMYKRLNDRKEYTPKELGL